MMEKCSGKSVQGGVAAARLRFLRPAGQQTDVPAGTPEQELARLEQALRKAAEQQNALYEQTAAEAGEEVAQVFSIHAMMLEDECFTGPIRDRVRAGESCACAVRASARELAAQFAAMEDEYMRERSADVEDIAQELLAALAGDRPAEAAQAEPFIAAAEDLTPSQTVRLDKKLLRGIVTRGGSSNSHTAILARSLGLPALVQCPGVGPDWDGRMAVLDADEGTLTPDPSPAELAAAREKAERAARQARELEQLRGLPNTTRDGRTVEVYANIGGTDELELASDQDAGGVGLFRSEFLYLHSGDYPTEEEQFAAYRAALEHFAPRRVVVRTCDIGADKTVDYMGLAKEENPALGLRAVRLCLSRPQFFKTQLRALARASAFGSLSVMFPMIISAAEVRRCKELLAECCRELKAEKVPVGPIELGVMIETPAAALCADELAEEVDFFSIGTNDLTQYTCALDRQNAALEPFSDPHHPAVLRLIEMTVQAGHRHGCWVGICGELGADLTLTETFLKMGVDEFSVNPVSILPLRGAIRRSSAR